MIYIAAVFIFFTIFALVSAVLFTFFYKEKAIDKLKYYDDDYAVKEKLESNKRNKTSIIKLLAELVPDKKLNAGRNQRLELELMKADIPITVEELLVIKILFSMALSFLTVALFRSIFLVIISLIFVWIAPKFIISSRKKERIKQFNYQLNEGVMIISNSLKAGYSFMQSVSVVVEETKDPFSKEFKKLLKEMSLGISEEDALRNLMERMESEDLKLIMNAILIQKDIGGNLSEILDNIGETIRERQKIQNELKTLTAQGKLSGMIVMLIPIFLGIIIYTFNKEYMILLFTTPIGLAMVVMAIFNQVLGFFMIRKIISIDM
jgi:tight adherence protein B